MTASNMNIVDVSECRRNLVGEIPASVVDEAIHKLAQEYAKKARVPGFRPGKVPLSIIKQRFASELRNDAAQDLIARSWKTAVEEKNLSPLAEPVVEKMEAEPGRDMSFTVSFEVLPQIEIRDHVGIAASVDPQEISDDMVQAELERLREKHAEYVPKEEDAAQDGYLVTMDLEGEFQDGGETLRETDVACLVGGTHTNEVFSENLRGARLGDTREFVVSYPEDHHRKSFAGKSVNYRASVKDIKEKVLPDLDDEFARDMVGAESLFALREKIRAELVTKASELAEEKAREAVLDDLVERHPFEVPECLVQDELHSHGRRIAGNLARQGIDVTRVSIDWKKVFEQERPHAEKEVRRMLVLRAVADREGIEMSEAELDEEFRKLAEGGRKSAQAIRAQLEKDKQIQGFRDHLRQKKALDFIFRNANISRG